MTSSSLSTSSSSGSASLSNTDSSSSRVPKTGPVVMSGFHQQMTELFKTLLSLNTDPETRERVKGELITVVTKHILTEEQVLYPTIKTVAPEYGEDVSVSVEQETLIKQNLIRLDTLKIDDDYFQWFAKETFSALLKHINHEEKTLFPIVKKKLGEDELNNMGELIETIFEVAPTRPLPVTTQKPITEICAQPLTVYFEKVRNLASRQRAAVFR